MEVPNLRAVRLRRLLTQDDLAAKTGMTKASISRLETGATKARISTVRKLLAALDVGLDDLTAIASSTPNSEHTRKEHASRDSNTEL